MFSHLAPLLLWLRIGRVQWLPSEPLGSRLAGREEEVNGCVERLCCDLPPGSKAELEKRRVMICGSPGVGKVSGIPAVA